MTDPANDAPAPNPPAEATGPDTLSVLEDGDRRVVLVGTAHVSAESVREVEEVITREQPDTVCVELDPQRHAALTDENRWKNLDIFAVIREGKTLYLLANLAIGAYQRRIGAELGVQPGAELLEAVRAAERAGAGVALVDRDIHITLKRTWANISFLRKMGVLGGVLEGLVTGGAEVDAEQIEELKQSANLSAMMEEFVRVLPEVAEPLIDERDRYMAERIHEVAGKRVVAVVGAAHAPGIRRYYGELQAGSRTIDTDALEALPQPGWFGRVAKWLIPAIVLVAFGFGFQRGAGQTLEQMLYAWVLPNAIFAALFAAIAGAKPFSVVTAFFASPITSMNPTIGAAMVVGPVEAWLRKPTVADAQRINDDVQSLRGFYRNPFTRVLLVAMMANVGSGIGGMVGTYWVLRVLSG